MRIGPQLGEELRQRSLEPDLLQDRLHLAANAGDFAQPFVVNLLRRQRRRRMPSGEMSVELRALRHLPDADLVESRREIFVDEIFLQLLEGGENAGRDGFAGGFGQTLAVWRRRSRREIS